MKNKKTTKKKILIRIAVFAVVLAVGFVYLSEVFRIPNTDFNRQIINAFYAQEEDTIDAVYMGTSATNRYFIGPLCYEESGMTIFNVATMGMPIFFEPILIDEVEKTQSPELYIFELRWTKKTKDKISDAHIRRVTDSMKFSHNRNRAIAKALKVTEGADSDISDNAIDYYFPIIKYHSILASGKLSVSDLLLKKEMNHAKGYVLSEGTITVGKQQEAVVSDERAPLSDMVQTSLQEFLDYIEDNNKQALFVLSPYPAKEGDKEVLNSAIDMVKEAGYPVLDFNTPEMYKKLGIDWSRDFYDEGHVNYMGAQKYTKYLTKYIKANYDLDDHRGDNQYKSWDMSYDAYLKHITDNELIFDN